MDDPHFYVWFVVMLWLVNIYAFGYMIMDERKVMRRERLAMLLKRAESLIREKKLNEAEACLEECKSLARYNRRNR